MPENYSELDRKIVANPFYVDHRNPGIVRGGFFDELGGMLVGTHAQYVADSLNENAARGTDS